MELIDKATLDMLGEAAQKYGIQRFECDGFKVTFLPPQQPRLILSSDQASQPIGERYGMPTEDELLFASSPYPVTDDEIQARPPG